MDEIVVTANTSAAWFPDFSLFGLDNLFWGATNDGVQYQSLSDAFAEYMSSNAPQVSVAKTDHTPNVVVSDGEGDTIVVTGKRVDTITSLIGHSSGNANIAREMQEWHDHNVTWKVVFVNASDFDAAANAAHLGKDHNDLFAFSQGYYASGNHVADNSTVTTYVLKSEGTGSTMGEDLVHELLHYSRDTGGNFIYPPTDPNSETRIHADQDGVYDQIYRSKTVNLDGSATNSATLDAPGAGTLLYGTNGNNVITAHAGANTIVAYNSNDLIEGGSGNDFYKVLGSGTKVIDDTGGSNSLYVPWAHNFYDFKTLLTGDGTLFLAPVSSNTSADQSPDRIVIPGWSDAHFATVQYTDASGQLRSAIVDNLIIGEHGGGGGHLVVGDATQSSAAASTTPLATPAASYDYVVGTPQAGFYDPYANGSGLDHSVGNEPLKTSAQQPIWTSAHGYSPEFHAHSDWALA